MSLVSQIRALLVKLADGIDSLNIDTKSFRGSLENLKRIESVHLYTKGMVKRFIELNEDLKHVGSALDENNIELVDKSVKNLENRIHYMVSSIAKSELRMIILMSLTIFLLTVASVATSYSFIYYHMENYSIVFMIISMGIGSVALIGFFLRFLLTAFLIPSIPLISLLQLIAILTKGYMDDYTLILLFVTCCSLFLSLNINVYMARMYKNAILAFLNFSQTIESILSKINRIEIRRLSSSMQNLVEDYKKVYSNEAYELIKYIEEISRVRG